MEVILLADANHLAYEEFLQNHKGAMIYYSLKFRDFLEKMTAGKSDYYIAVNSNGEIEGILPLMIKTGKFGKILNSLPYYGSNGGIMSNNDEAKAALLEQYKHIIESEGIAAATIVENPLDRNYDYSCIERHETDMRIGQFTDIKGDFQNFEELLVKFHSKTRNIIRKSIKSDVSVKIENDMFDFLESTHRDNLETIGGLAKTKLFFSLIQEIFSEGIDYNLYVARFNNIPVAAVLVLYYGKVVEYYTPVIVKEYRNMQALSFVIAQAMLDANNRGFELWNWGGTWLSQDGVYEFKSKWGTDDKRYDYHVSILNKELYKCSKADLLTEYAGFYVMPFSRLNS